MPEITNEEFFENIENALLVTKDKQKRLKLLAVKRSIFSLLEFILHVKNASIILKCEDEVDWFYDKFRELKKEVKR